MDVGGRPLRVDLADSDPFLEGKTTQHGELVDSGETRAQWREREKRERMEGDGRNPSNLQRNETNSFLRSLPPGVPLVPGTTSLDAISHTLATMNPAQLTEVLAQMKVDKAVPRFFLSAFSLNLCTSRHSLSTILTKREFFLFRTLN